MVKMEQNVLFKTTGVIERGSDFFCCVYKVLGSAFLRMKYSLDLTKFSRLVASNICKIFRNVYLFEHLAVLGQKEQQCGADFISQAKRKSIP